MNYLLLLRTAVKECGLEEPRRYKMTVEQELRALRNFL